MTRTGGTSPKAARGRIESNATASDLAKEARNASIMSANGRSREDKYSDGTISAEGRVHSIEFTHYGCG